MKTIGKGGRHSEKKNFDVFLGEAFVQLKLLSVKNDNFSLVNTVPLISQKTRWCTDFPSKTSFGKNVGPLVR